MADGYEALLQGYRSSSTQLPQFGPAPTTVATADVSDAYFQTRLTDSEKPSHLESEVSQTDYLGFDSKEYSPAAESGVGYMAQTQMMPSPMGTATYNGIPLDFQAVIADKLKEFE